MNLCADGIGGIFITLYYMYGSNNTVVCCSAAILFLMIGLFGITYFMPESPLWLLKMGRSGEAVEIIKKIYKLNGVPVDETEFEDSFKKS